MGKNKGGGSSGRHHSRISSSDETSQEFAGWRKKKKNKKSKDPSYRTLRKVAKQEKVSRKRRVVSRLNNKRKTKSDTFVEQVLTEGKLNAISEDLENILKVTHNRETSRIGLEQEDADSSSPHHIPRPQSRLSFVAEDNIDDSSTSTNSYQHHHHKHHKKSRRKSKKRLSRRVEHNLCNLLRDCMKTTDDDGTPLENSSSSEADYQGDESSTSTPPKLRDLVNRSQSVLDPDNDFESHHHPHSGLNVSKEVKLGERLAFKLTRKSSKKHKSKNKKADRDRKFEDL